MTKQATRTMKEVSSPMKGKNQWDPIPVTYTELLLKLIDDGLIMLVHLVPLRPPFSRWYNVNTRCNYYVGIPGHSIKDYKTFKNKVQILIEEGKLKFEESSGPVRVEDLSRVKAKVKTQEKKALKEASSENEVIPRDDVPISKIKKMK